MRVYSRNEVMKGIEMAESDASARLSLTLQLIRYANRNMVRVMSMIAYVAGACIALSISPGPSIMDLIPYLMPVVTIFAVGELYTSYYQSTLIDRARSEWIDIAEELGGNAGNFELYFERTVTTFLIMRAIGTILIWGGFAALYLMRMGMGL